MDKSGKIILVTGATGTQGNAVARALLKEGWRVRAFVRDAAKPQAQRLAQLGAELVRGQFDDRDSLNQALNGVYGVFAVQGFMEQGIEGEVRQGEEVADAAKAAGVQHFLYTSVHSADLASGVPHFDSKGRIEEHVRGAGLPHTVLRPVFFMENFTSYFPPALEEGTYVLRLALHPETKLSIIAADDIGAFSAIIFRDPARYLGKAFEIAGDMLTMPQIASEMQKHVGKPFRFEELPVREVRKFSEDFALMFEYFNDKGQPVDVSGLHTIHPSLMDFASWLKATNWQPK